MISNSFKAILILAALVLAVACSGGGGGSSTTFAKSGDWLDNNNDGIYDPYQDQSLWNDMNSMTSAAAPSWLGPRLAFAAQQRAWRGKGKPAPQWRDSNGDGVCDYAQDPKLWSRDHSGAWVDNNGDGVCDNYPNHSQWRGGWR
ncbi:MAG: hypothetical protein KJ720_13770 [Proteobacteria bacterium]|nr:hypothetical protein [Pseudomonadota bacterium]MBU1450506.1 hypothetical protein [Pseudomonadota bacterium]MBU2469581.1 hypothetical protein [Pseudomonadota bacterium]MBU2519594.1 hypothetical protein [Pseudomonadota bacterium]